MNRLGLHIVFLLQLKLEKYTFFFFFPSLATFYLCAIEISLMIRLNEI